jgi:hypothetical protein
MNSPLAMAGATMSDVMQLVRKQLDVIAANGLPVDDLPEWKAIVEEIVALLLHTWERLSALDIAMHRRWLTDVANYDEEYATLHELHRQWQSSAALYCDRARWAESHGLSVAGAERLEECCREMAGVLTADEEFFAGPKLERLTEVAVAEHRRGETEPLLEGNDA